MSGLIQGKASAKDLIGTAASPTTCAASGAYTASSIIDLGGARKVTIYVAYNAAAANGVLSMVPLFSSVRSKRAPGATDDSWFAPGLWDGLVTAGTLTALSLPAGTDFTVAPDFARVLNRALDLRSEPADNGTDKIRKYVTIDVSAHLWMQLLYAEAGVVGSPGAAWLSYVLHT